MSVLKEIGMSVCPEVTPFFSDFESASSLQNEKKITKAQ